MPENVTYSVSPVVKVIQIMRDLDLAPASSIGWASIDPSDLDHVMGILHGAKPRHATRWWRTRRVPRAFIGRFIFRALTATWLLEVFGEQYVEVLRPLAERAAEACNTKIDIRLMSTYARCERLPGTPDY